MGQFDDLIALRGTGSSLDRLTPSQLVPNGGLGSDLRLPADYVEFIECVGFGVVGNDVLAIYNGLIGPEDIFGSKHPTLCGILIFADDMAGNSFGFRVKDWSVVEVSACGELQAESPMSFADFIRTKIYSSK